MCPLHMGPLHMGPLRVQGAALRCHAWARDKLPPVKETAYTVVVWFNSRGVTTPAVKEMNG